LLLIDSYENLRVAIRNKTKLFAGSVDSMGFYEFLKTMDCAADMKNILTELCAG